MMIYLGLHLVQDVVVAVLAPDPVPNLAPGLTRSLVPSLAPEVHSPGQDRDHHDVHAQEAVPVPTLLVTSLRRGMIKMAAMLTTRTVK